MPGKEEVSPSQEFSERILFRHKLPELVQSWALEPFDARVAINRFLAATNLKEGGYGNMRRVIGYANSLFDTNPLKFAASLVFYELDLHYGLNGFSLKTMFYMVFLKRI